MPGGEQKKNVLPTSRQPDLSQDQNHREYPTIPNLKALQDAVLESHLAEKLTRRSHDGEAAPKANLKNLPFPMTHDPLHRREDGPETVTQQKQPKKP